MQSHRDLVYGKERFEHCEHAKSNVINVEYILGYEC